MATFLHLIPKLREGGVQFVIIGGVAALVHGAERSTQDLDVVAPMDLENLQRLIRCLEEFHPKFLTRPDLPIVTPENRNLLGINNLYLLTDIGQLDVLGLVQGVGDYAEVLKRSIEADFGEEIGRCKVIDLDGLIEAKRTAGRPKDKPAVAELEVIRRRKHGGPPPSTNV
jgi:hypothetical protein